MDETRRSEPAEPRRTDGVRRVLALVAMLAPLAAVPYFVPALERLRPWQPGSEVPFAHVLELRPFTAPAPGGAGGPSAEAMSDAQLLAAAVGEVARSPGVDARAAAPLVDHARIPPSEWAEMTRPIDDPTGAMRHFHAALRATARRSPSATTRVLVYADSINASDRVTSTLRHKLQDRFGDAGKGFVPIVPGWPYQVHQDVRWERRGGLRTTVVNTRRAEGDRYGLGGVLAVNAGPGARASFGAEASRYGLFYQVWPGGGDVLLRVDGRDLPRVSTHAPVVADRVAERVVPDGDHDLELRVDGEARLYGVAIERDGPGVVVDGLMLVGAFTRVLGQFDPDHWAGQIALREPDLVVFWLGSNDAASHTTGLDARAYVDGYVRSIAAARSGHARASCLVMSIVDSRDARRRRVRSLVDAQREVAARTRCAFFDTYTATGGAGTMARWQRTSPRLAETDGKHLTTPGARVVGTLLYQALLHGYDGWLASQPDG